MLAAGSVYTQQRGDKERALNGDVVVFYGIEIFVLFSSIWDVCVVARHKMTMWQGSYQMKCAQWKSCGGSNGKMSNKADK
jgi:hypothetical protein